MFPNVNLVTSENILFEDGRDILVYNNTLLNSFYKTPEYTIDMKGIVAIAGLALHKCKAKHVIHTDSLTVLANKAFSGYDCFTDPKTKAKIFGDILVSPDINTETIEIPDDRYNIRILCKFTCSVKNKAIKIHKYKTLKQMSSSILPKKLIMEIRDDEDGFWEFPSVLANDFNDCVQDFEIHGSRYFKAYDGILYSADM